MSTGKGKKSEFEYSDGHADKQILNVELTSEGLKYAWRIPSEDEDGNKVDRSGGANEPEPPHEDLVQAMQSLEEWVRKYCISGAGQKTVDYWKGHVTVRAVKFNYNQKGNTAAITATLTGDDGKAALVKLPHVPLFDEQIEGHANGQVITYGDYLTDHLEKLLLETKKFIGGKRGPQQARLMDKNGEPVAEEA